MTMTAKVVDLGFWVDVNFDARSVSHLIESNKLKKTNNYPLLVTKNIVSLKKVAHQVGILNF